MVESLGGKMKYKYIYKGSGVMTFYDSKGIGHTVSYKNREVILDEKLDIFGLEVEEIKEIKESKEVKKIKEED